MYVTEATLKSYLLLERRAFLQNVHADERLLAELENIERMLTDGTVDLRDIVKNCVTIVRRNTEERRKALLQVVRNTEKTYGLKSKSRKSRRK